MEAPIIVVLRQYSRQLHCFTLVAKYFLNPFVFDQIKSDFLLREWYLAAIFSLLPFSRNFVEFMRKSYFFVSKLVCFAISLDAILPE
jgi:hypothetical protein